MKEPNIADILKGVAFEDYLETATEEEIRILQRTALYQVKGLKCKMNDAMKQPDLNYSAVENELYIMRLEKLKRFLNVVEIKCKNKIGDLNHRRKMQNKRDAALKEKMKAYRRAISDNCSKELQGLIFTQVRKEFAEIENKYFPGSVELDI